jgi:hypothetical protein
MSPNTFNAIVVPPTPIPKRRADTSKDMYNPENFIAIQPPHITCSSPKSPLPHSPWQQGKDSRPDLGDSTT